MVKTTTDCEANESALSWPLVPATKEKIKETQRTPSSVAITTVLPSGEGLRNGGATGEGGRVVGRVGRDAEDIAAVGGKDEEGRA